MSESALVPVEEDEELEEQILRFRMQGLTAQQIARKTMLSVHEVHRALDAILPKLDQNLRRRIISESLLICDRVLGQHMTTIADPESASIIIRCLCERRFWLGIGHGTDPVQLVQATKPERSTAALCRALASVGKPAPEPDPSD